MVLSQLTVHVNGKLIVVVIIHTLESCTGERGESVGGGRGVWSSGRSESVGPSGGRGVW